MLRNLQPLLTLFTFCIPLWDEILEKNDFSIPIYRLFGPRLLTKRQTLAEKYLLKKKKKKNKKTEKHLSN